MKKLLVVLILGVFVSSCGGNGGVEAVGDSQAVSMDTLGGTTSGTMMTDTTTTR